METKHTKGRWRNGLENENAVICQTDYGKILTISKAYVSQYISQDEALANAKLIASAPMLLEALQKVKSELMYENLINKEKSSGRNWQVELDIINQVIKKATE